MVQARLTQKGQVTIPKAIRDYLHLNTGSEIDFVIDGERGSRLGSISNHRVDENGEVKMIPLNISVETLSGILHREGMKAVSLADMEQAISEGANDRT